MNPKQLLIVAVLLLVALGGMYMMKSGKEKRITKQPAKLGGEVFPDFDANDIERVTITAKDKSVNLASKEGTWKVEDRDDYAVNFDKLTGFLRKFEKLKIIQSDSVGKSNLGAQELQSPGSGDEGKTGTLVEFKDSAGKVKRSLLLGKRYESPSGGSGGGRFVKEPDSSDYYYVVSEPFYDLDAEPRSWIKTNDFFRVKELKSVAVTHPEESDSYTLAREAKDGELKLQDPKEDEEVDTSKLGAYSSIFGSTSFYDVVPKAQAAPETTGLDNPVKVQIETFEDFTYVINIGKTTGEDKYHLSYTVDARIPQQRPVEEEPAAEAKPEGAKPEDAKPEDAEELSEEEKKKAEEEKKKKDEEAEEKFQAEKKRLEEKLTFEKKFVDRVYLVDKWTVQKMLDKRSALLKAEEVQDPPASIAIDKDLTPQTPPKPGGSAKTTTKPGGKKTITATTPPIAVPPLPEKPEADKPKAGEPEADKPKADKPKADKPKAGEPEADKPKADKPEADEPEADKPKVEKSISGEELKKILEEQAKKKAAEAKKP